VTRYYQDVKCNCNCNCICSHGSDVVMAIVERAFGMRITNERLKVNCNQMDMCVGKSVKSVCVCVCVWVS